MSDEDEEGVGEADGEPSVVLGGPQGRTEYLYFRVPPSIGGIDVAYTGRLQLTYRMARTESKLVRAVLESNGFRPTSSNEFNLLWTGSPVKSHMLQSLNAYQKVNRFPQMHELTRKDKLCRNLGRMREIHGARHFDFIPATFVLPAEYDQLQAEHARAKDAMWITKPCASSCGRGILIAAQLHSLPLDDACVVSRYVTNPLLVDGFKFDMRLVRARARAARSARVCAGRALIVARARGAAVRAARGSTSPSRRTSR